MIIVNEDMSESDTDCSVTTTRVIDPAPNAEPRELSRTSERERLARRPPRIRRRNQNDAIAAADVLHRRGSRLQFQGRLEAWG